jgi:Glycosyl hydrolase family 115/Gylcosyl hydrolase family 115 C-terminal domain
MTLHRAFLVAGFSFLMLAHKCLGIGQALYVETAPSDGSFAIAAAGTTADLCVDPNDYAGVVRAVGDLRADVRRVTGCIPAIVHEPRELKTRAVIIGSIGKSRVIDQLIREGKIDPAPIAGKWESFFLQVVPAPLPGLESALVIVGSDKRGTIYGIYDLSEQIGVSPWYWWGDVPVHHHDAIYVKPGKYVQGPPAVKYRGIFLNDEDPDLTGWANETFGGYNHLFYEKIFELLLRLKANYLWPAMWHACFNEDDPLNPKLADEYGIVMGTSHVEPMMRADKEWGRAGYKPRQWNYATNPEILRQFWDNGILRNNHYECIVTMAMRGKIDTPMASVGGMPANIALLEKVVADQRKVLANRINPDITKIPQLWCLYKEVQEYYDAGMRVPDDITLLWSDDNWGNIRRLPTAAERNRSGGAGVYYHFDYVGGPRNYKWINTSPIAKVWEQMTLAYDYGAERIWIVNVGHLQHVEFPTEFFLNLAWDPQRWGSNDLMRYTRLWAAREFGPDHADEIADLIERCTKYNGRIKPELLSPDTFSLVNYNEADKVLADYADLVAQAEKTQDQLRKDAKDAFFEFVLDPAKAYWIVAQLYVTVGKNHLYAAQGRASTNELADQAKSLFEADQQLSDYYNHTLAGGKWNHMMDQTHIGYTRWQQPKTNIMPKVVRIVVPKPAKLGVAIEGSASAWPGDEAKPILPDIDAFNRQSRYIDVFNRGRTPFHFTATVSNPWIILSRSDAVVDQDLRLLVSVDWNKAPLGNTPGSVTIAGPRGQSVTVKFTIVNPREITRDNLDGFVETDRCVSIEAEHYTAKSDSESSHWFRIEDYGRTLSAMSIRSSTDPPQGSPCLQYTMYLFDTGKAEVSALIAPTQAFVPGCGLRLAISIDDQKPLVVDSLADHTPKAWERSVIDNIRVVRVPVTVAEPGYHVLKFWMVDPGVVLEKLIVDFGGVRPSFLGPPESYRRLGN